jgi:hypothetical protein
MVDRGLGVSLLPDWAPPWPEGLSCFAATQSLFATHRIVVEQGVAACRIDTCLPRSGTRVLGRQQEPAHKRANPDRPGDVSMTKDRETTAS